MGVKYDMYFTQLKRRVENDPSKLELYSINISALELLSDDEIELLESGIIPSDARCAEMADNLGCEMPACRNVFKQFVVFFSGEVHRGKPE